MASELRTGQEPENLDLGEMDENILMLIFTSQQVPWKNTSELDDDAYLHMFAVIF